MRVPEAAVNKESCLVLRKYKIGSAREFPVVQAVAQASGMQATSQHKLRFGVLTLNAAHVASPLFRGEHVNHSSPDFHS